MRALVIDSGGFNGVRASSKHSVRLSRHEPVSLIVLGNFASCRLWVPGWLYKRTTRPNALHKSPDLWSDGTHAMSANALRCHVAMSCRFGLAPCAWGECMVETFDHCGIVQTKDRQYLLVLCRNAYRFLGRRGWQGVLARIRQAL
eukprot:6144183-Amphidinium_carterae.1